MTKLQAILIDRPYLESKIKLPGHPWKYLPPEALERCIKKVQLGSVSQVHWKRRDVVVSVANEMVVPWEGTPTLMTNSNRNVEVNPMLLLIQYPTYIDKSWFIVPPKVSIHCSPSDETKHCCLSCGYQTIWGCSNHVTICQLIEWALKAILHILAYTVYITVPPHKKSIFYFSMSKINLSTQK